MRQSLKAALLIVVFTALGFGLVAKSGADTDLGEKGLTLEAVKKKIVNIGTAELQKILKKDPNTIIIDVRTVRETVLTGGIIRAKRNFIIPRGWLEFRIADATKDKNAPIVVYCGTNRRSPLAAYRLMQLGFTNVKNYADGFPAWKKAGLPIEVANKWPDSFLYSKPQEVIKGVWTSIGATAPSTYENAGHNNNLSFIVTTDGVLVFNAGGSYLLARSLHEEIKKVTDKPVKYVVLENGQGHAMLGSAYWKEQGAIIISHEDTVHEIEEKGRDSLDSARRRLREKAFLTKVVLPDETFGDKRVIEMGGVRMELLHLGPAHSPGDIMLWMPKERLIITGDMAFHERLLPVFVHTDTGAWLETWEKFAALKAKYVIPGHGGPTNMAEVTKYTRDYLAYMRKKIGELVEDGGTLLDAYKIDQSAFEHLDTYEILARQNAGRIFRAMEFE